eukprot:8033474-Heterocapsa_arctica.AAC.1
MAMMSEPKACSPVTEQGEMLHVEPIDRGGRRTGIRLGDAPELLWQWSLQGVGRSTKLHDECLLLIICHFALRHCLPHFCPSEP